MVRLCSQNPTKDVTLVRDLCISSEERPILIPHANGGHDIPLVVSAPYAAFYHDRNPELKGASQLHSYSTGELQTHLAISREAPRATRTGA